MISKKYEKGPKGPFYFLSKPVHIVAVFADTTREVTIMLYPDLYALLRSDPESLRRNAAKRPFPLGVYPVFDDDLPRDPSFDNFPAPDLRDLHPDPRGLQRQEEQ